MQEIPLTDLAPDVLEWCREQGHIQTNPNTGRRYVLNSDIGVSS